jgi:hypothetical protein
VCLYLKLGVASNLTCELRQQHLMVEAHVNQRPRPLLLASAPRRLATVLIFTWNLWVCGSRFVGLHTAEASWRRPLPLSLAWRTLYTHACDAANPVNRQSAPAQATSRLPAHTLPPCSFRLCGPSHGWLLTSVPDGTRKPSKNPRNPDSRCPSLIPQG